MSITRIDKKKNGLQGYRVRVRVKARDGSVKQIERSAWGKASAQAIEKELMQLNYTIPSDSKITVNQLYDEYIEAKASEIRETSLETLSKALRLSVLPSFGETPVSKLTTPLLQAWKNSLAEENFSLSTKKNRFSEFKGMLNFAVGQGYLAQNPMRNIKQFRDVGCVEDTKVRHYYLPEEYIRYAEIARLNGLQRDTIVEWGYFVFFSIAFYTGARKGEINALKWSDVDGNTIHVRRSITQKLKGGDRETLPKNKSSCRSIVAPKVLVDILAEHKARQKQYESFSEDWRVCGGSRCLRDTSIEKRNAEFARKAGLPHIRIHDFRHTHATFLVNSGVNIKEVSRRLGHSTVEQTWNTYSHLFPQTEQAAVDALNLVQPSPQKCPQTHETRQSAKNKEE